MSARMRLFIDIVERAAWTWAQTFLGLLIAANVWESTQAGELISVLEVAQVAAVSALPAALAVIKGGIASLMGDRNSAATLPAELD